jgi:hypothetical protein
LSRGGDTPFCNQCTCESILGFDLGDDSAAPSAIRSNAAFGCQLDSFRCPQEDSSAFLDEARCIQRAAVPDDGAGEANPAGVGQDAAQVGGGAVTG